MLARLQRWNLALDEIRAGNVLAENETSPEASACRKHYPQVIAEMLTERDFSFTNQRRALSPLATVDRPYEWAYAYSLPGDMASPLRLIPDLSALGVGVPVPLLGDPYAETWGTNRGQYIDAPYIIEGSTLYSNVSSAVLEFTLSNIDNLPTGPLLDRAITLELASRLAVPVKGDRELKRELLAQAEIAWQKAVADDRNRQQTTDGQYISETEAARRGFA